MSFCPTCKRVHDGTETRAQILAAARVLFAERPYEAAGLRDIAAVVGCSLSTIYGHWPTKDELFAEAIGRPHLTDARGAELLEALKLHAPEVADELLKGWSA